MNTPQSFETMKQLQEFEPARSWLWDLSFTFAPFNNPNNNSTVTGISGLSEYIPQKVVSWIPADTLQRTIAIVESMDLQVGQSNFKLPSGTSAKDITINFIDDYKQSIKDWIEIWMNNIILCDGNSVNFLSEVVDVLTIKDMYPDHTTRKTYKLYVYPDGPLVESNTSDSSIKMYSQNFVVCGKAS